MDVLVARAESLVVGSVPVSGPVPAPNCANATLAVVEADEGPESAAESGTTAACGRALAAL